MDHLLVLRDKIGRLREEIADIQKLNGMTAWMGQMLKSLTEGGTSGCKRSSMSLFNSESLVGKSFRQNKWGKTIALGCTSSSRNGHRSVPTSVSVHGAGVREPSNFVWRSNAQPRRAQWRKNLTPSSRRRYPHHQRRHRSGRPHLLRPRLAPAAVGHRQLPTQPESRTTPSLRILSMTKWYALGLASGRHSVGALTPLCRSMSVMGCFNNWPSQTNKARRHDQRAGWGAS